MTRSFFGRDPEPSEEDPGSELPSSPEPPGPDVHHPETPEVHAADRLQARQQPGWLTGAPGEGAPSSPPAHAVGFWLKAPSFRGRRPRPPGEFHETSVLAATLADLARRLETLEQRSTAEARAAADPAASLRTRLDGVERDLATVAEIMGETLSSPPSARPGAEDGGLVEAIGALEEAIGRVAAQLVERDARGEAQALQAREGLRALRLRLDRLEAQFDPLAVAPAPSAAVVEAALAPLVRRVEETQRRTLGSLEGLEGSLAGLEGLVLRMAHAASPPSIVVDAVESAPGRAGDQEPEPLEAALRDLSDQVAAIDHRSATAINRMGLEVIRLAESLDDRVEKVERRSGERAAEMGGEMARLAQVVDDRLTRADDARAEALEKLGARIASVALQLADRIALSERRSAQGVAAGLQAATEQLHRATHALNADRERTARDLAERIRTGEDQAARLRAAAPEDVRATAAEALAARPAQGHDGPAVPPNADRRGAAVPETPAEDEATRAAMEAIAAGVGAFHAVDSSRREPPTAAPPPSTPRSANRELIEAARAAARTSAEAGQHSPNRPAASAKKTPDGSEVLTLKSRFALPLSRRRDG